MYPYLLLVASLQASAQPSVPVIENCFEPERIIATLSSGDSVRIRSSIAGDTQTCYAVTAAVNGSLVNGYVLGDAVPGVAQYERQRRAGAPLQEAAPPEQESVTQDNKPHVLFEDFSAVDLKGSR